MHFWKECKKIVFSLTYVVYLVAVIAIYATQFGVELKEPLNAPKAGDDYYGLVKTDDEETIMTSALYSLLYEYGENTYIAYPFGLYKEIKLNESEKVQMERIIAGLTEADNLTISETVTYEEFLQAMEEVDDLLGGGSSYSKNGILTNFASVTMTYEDALAEYESLTQGKELLKSYTRLFCDYMGIILAIMPIFVCAALWQADKKAGIEALIFSRKISSIKLVGVRYLALLFMLFLPIAGTYIHTIISLNSLYKAAEFALAPSVGMMLLWLLPEIMIVISLGMVVSILWLAFGAIFVQVIWWFFNVMLKLQLSGAITKWDLVVRHNTLYEVQLFYSQYDTFVWNRVFYLTISVLLFGVAVWIYDKKRKGQCNGKSRLFKNHTKQS